MASKQDLKAAQQRIFARPRAESESDRELVRKTEDDGVYPSPLNIKAVRLERIVPDPARPPRLFSDESLTELGRSLLLHGQITPIVVHYDSDEDVFVLIDGERRWRAAQKVGLPTMQALIVSRMTTSQRLDHMMILALHQQPLDCSERVQALQAYKRLKGLQTWADVAQNLGLTEATIEAMLQQPAAQDEESDRPSDPISQVVAAMHLLDHALSHLPAAEGSDGEIGAILDDLEDRLAAQRARLEHRAPRSEGGKPVHHMRTWGSK